MLCKDKFEFEKQHLPLTEVFKSIHPNQPICLERIYRLDKIGIWAPYYMQKKVPGNLNIIRNIVTHIKWYGTEKIGFENISFLVEKSSPEGHLSNSGSWIAEIFLWVEIFVFHSPWAMFYITKFVFLFTNSNQNHNENKIVCLSVCMNLQC